jgi:ribonuclease P protein component
MKLRAIRENHLYSKAYANGKKYVGRNMVVYLLPDYAAARIAKANPTKKRCNRVGITVTKKIGGAVERNRAKRIIREG